VSRLDFESREEGQLAVIALRGELDLTGTVALEPELDRLVERADVEVVALDFRELDFLDSSGLRLVMRADQRLQATGRRLALVRGPEAVQRVFDITRMSDRLDFVDAPEQVRT
jgi:anti-sigma B factor antagonist